MINKHSPQPYSSQTKAKLSRPMDANISNRFEKLREEGVDAHDEAEEEENVFHSSSKRVNVDPEPRLDDDSEEPSLRAVRKQRLTCTNLLSCVASFLKFYLISKF